MPGATMADRYLQTAFDCPLCRHEAGPGRMAGMVHVGASQGDLTNLAPRVLFFSRARSCLELGARCPEDLLACLAVRVPGPLVAPDPD